MANSIWGGTGSSTTTTEYTLGTNWSSNPIAPTDTGQSAEFTNTGRSTVTVTNTFRPITPDNWIFDTNSQAYTISGAEVDFSGAGIINNAIAGTINIADIIGGIGGVTQSGNGTLVLAGANTYSGGTRLRAGTLDLAGEATSTGGGDSDGVGFNSGETPNSQTQSTAAGTGTITFDAPQGATLAIEQGALIGHGPSNATFYNPIAGFATAQNGAGSDIIDLRNLANGVATFDYNTDQLSVSGTFMGTSETETLTLQGNYTGFVFNTTSDGNGGTKVTLSAQGSSGGGGGGGVTSTPTPPTNPTITGTHATADAGEASVTPFGTSAASGPVVIADGNANASETLTIALQSGGGTLADGTGYSGLTFANGVYTLTGTASAVTAELDALAFKPTNDIPGATVSTTFQLTDRSSAGTSATDGNTVVSDTAAVVSPTIKGTHATNDTSEAPVLPFSGVVIADANANATDSLVITLTGGGGALSGLGLTGSGNRYALAATDPTTLTRELDALTFVPTAGALEQPNPTTFTLTDTSSAGRSATDSGTVVTDTAFNSRNPAPTPDAVSISPVVTYANGVFTLSGTASSAAGASPVEISAVVDGARRDLGAATVNPDGTFTFQDAVTDQQSFFQAKLPDGTVSADPGFNLTGGLGPRGANGRQENFSPTQEVSSILFAGSGLRQVSVEAPGQTVNLQPYDTVFNHGRGNNTFVYTPGGETGVVDVIHGFVAGGANHDVLSLKGADFGNSIAKVLRDTGDVGGSAFLTDPVTGDAILFAGVSTAQLKPKDFTFHA